MMNNIIFVAALITAVLSLESSAQTPGRVDSSTIHTGANAPANYIKNPSGFDNALGITVSSATIARDASGSSDLLDGKASLVCDASSQNGYCEFDTNTIQEGDKTGNCEAKAIFKGDASLYKLQVTDGSTVLTSSSLLSNATDWTSVSVNYPCGATREVRLTQTEAGTGAAVNIGRVYWGQSTNLGAQNPISDWVSFTPTGSWSTNTTYTGYYRRVGDAAEIIYHVSLSGAPTAATFTVNPPSGLTIDNTKAPTGTNVGAAGITAAGTGYVGRVQIVGNTFRPLTTGIINATTPGTFTNGDALEFTVLAPIVGWNSATVASSSQQLLPTIQKFTSSSGTYTLPAGVVSIKVRMVGGGGGGSGSGSASAGNGGTGGNTTFGSSLLTANAGVGGVAQSSGGTGGTASISSPAIGTALSGGQGGTVQYQYNTGQVQLRGGNGASSPFGSGGGGGGYAAAINTGAGGGGASLGNVAVSWTGSGGGSGGYVEAIINNPSSTYAYAVGAAGTAGTAGTGGNAGGAGGSGYIEVTEYYSNATPLLVGSVTSNSSGLERVERAYLNCDSGSAITSQSGSWVSSIGNISSGTCTVTIASGIFSATPTCVMNQNANVGTLTVGAQASVSSATSFSITGSYNTGATTTTQTSFDANVICMGPR